MWLLTFNRATRQGRDNSNKLYRVDRLRHVFPVVDVHANHLLIVEELGVPLVAGVGAAFDDLNDWPHLITTTDTITHTNFTGAFPFVLQRERVFARSWHWAGEAAGIDSPGHVRPFVLLEECLDELNDLMAGLQRYSPTVLAVALRVHLGTLLQALLEARLGTREEVRDFVRELERDALQYDQD